MKTPIYLSILALIALVVGCGENGGDTQPARTKGPALPDTPWRTISSEASPKVEMTLSGDTIFFRAAPSATATPSARLVAARATMATNDFAALPASADVSIASLGDAPLRLWLQVSWTEPDGRLRQRESFFTPAFLDNPPPGISTMRGFDLEGLRSELADEANRIFLPLDMPFDGKATIVIDDPSGHRVRNLVNGLSFAKGHHDIEWDGRREDGTIAAPGEYRIRTIVHPGLSYELLGSFGNGGEHGLFMAYGPTHIPFSSLVAGPNGLVSASSLFTEGGHSTVVLDNSSGALRNAYSEGWNLGNAALFHVSGATNRFYSVREDTKPAPGPDGKECQYSIFQFFGYYWDDGHRPEVFVRTPDAQKIPGQQNGFRVAPAITNANGIAMLGGAAIAAGRLFVSDRLHRGVDAYPLDESGRATVLLPADRHYSVPRPGCLVADDAGMLWLASGTNILRMANPAADDATFKKACALSRRPKAMAVHSGELFALFEGEHQIFVYNASTGAELRRIGEPGGAYTGEWRKDRLINPTALCFDSNGALWVTESRHNPKRLTRWDATSGHVTYEKLGSESYGSPGAGMDPLDPTHWVGHDCEWTGDFATRKEAVTGILHPDTRIGDGTWNTPPTSNRCYRWVRRNGRTFVIANDAAATIYEYIDHRLIPLALVSSPGIYSHRLNDRHTHCKPMLDAFARARHPGEQEERFYGEGLGDEETLMLWVDRNRDQLMQADEFEFTPRGVCAPIGYWGFYVSDLDFNIAVSHGADMSILRFNAGDMAGDSLPDYSLADAWEKRTVVPDQLPVPQVPPNHQSGFSDTHGRTFWEGSEPYFLAFDADGHLVWHFKNQYVGVHGSHAAPLPIPGEFQAILFPMGLVPFSDNADIAALMNNHGRVYFLSTDGIYIDELFTDCRTSARYDETCIGGEAFGGSFAYDTVNKRALLQAGGGGYRTYAINGFDQIKEADSTISVNAVQLQTAARLNPLERPEERVTPELTIQRLPDASADVRQLVEWRTGGWNIRIDASYDAANLHLRYSVNEPSAWVNHGIDRFMMFKTGDCVDFQIATDQGSDPATRRGPAIGDIRLLVSPSADGSDKPNAIIYRHRIPDAEKPNAHPMEFNSPVMRYTVEDTTALESARASVRVDGTWYYVADIVVPLSSLGLDGARIAGKTYRGDFGVIFGDRDGTINLSRVYWANKETGLVNDVPGEMLPTPRLWGKITFGE